MPAPVKLRAVSFDVYGTLVDIRTDEDRPAAWEGLSRLLRRLQVVVDPQRLHAAYREELRRQLHRGGMPHPEIDVPRIFATVLARLGHQIEPSLARRLATRFRGLSRLRLAAFPDARPTLLALRKRVQLVAVSDAQRLFLEPELRTVGLADLLEELVVSSDHGYRKPDPRLFWLALERVGVPAEEALHVGDHPRRDVEGAAAAGMTAVLLDRSQSGGQPDGVLTVSTLLDLLPWVEAGG